MYFETVEEPILLIKNTTCITIHDVNILQVAHAENQGLYNFIASTQLLTLPPAFPPVVVEECASSDQVIPLP